MRRSPDTARRVMEVLERLDVIGITEAWNPKLVGRSTARARLRSLENLRTRYPRAFAELQAIAAEHTDAPASRSVAAGRDIGVAVTGDHNQFVIGNPGLPQTSGDHVDFRDGTFHDPVIGVQHNHYGTVPAPVEWRPVGQVEPLEFGVHRTRRVPGEPDVPPYVQRDRDEDLRAELAHSGLVLILGEPYAGKSYTAWHGVRSLADPNQPASEEHRFHAPDPGEDIRALLAALRGKSGKYVVWLDELTDHLDGGDLEPRLLVRLTGLGAVVLGTMSPDEYYRRRAGTGPGDKVVAAARTVTLSREWRTAELERLAVLDDPRAFPAYMWSGREGAASYFAVGHLLFDEWRRSGTRLEHPRGQLLVRAAVDLARCGVTGAVPGELLRRVQEQYGEEERESFEDALAWATAPLFGVSGLLVQGDEGDTAGTWRAYGALVAEALSSGDLEPVPDEVWWTLLDAAGEQDSPLVFRAVLDAACTALQARIEAGDPAVALGFARRTEGEEREAWLRRAADAGHPDAAVDLAEILRDRADEAGALTYLEQAAEVGSSRAAAALGSLLRKRAEYWLRTAAEAGDGAAAHELGDMLVGSGHEDEAARWYLKALTAGHHEVAASMGTLLNSWRDPYAEVWLRYGAAWGDLRAVAELAFHLSCQPEHDKDEVDRLYRQAAEGGDANAARALGTSLERQGRFDEAMALYHQAFEGDIPGAARSIGLLLRRQGKSEEAEEWLSKAVATIPPPPPIPTPTPTDSPDTVGE
ncbi:hypothetical protein AQJ91_22375 [Streptomyces dysideae]|uniref:Sel1 repeat family protein n=2 Tax=Streptomyces dysideae TaxID=909626 RepID=A0A101UY70_9ACTN|nr:hypothetical protein AQJ91_22375 [Streptomyces dysideae]